jgi:tellurite resistance protein TerC
MYFLLAGVVEKFRYLRYGLAVVLTFIGVKMLVTALGLHIPIWFSLPFVATMLLGSVAASFLFPPREAEEQISVDLPPDFEGTSK